MRGLFFRHAHGPGSYGEVLKISIPLILSTGSITLQHFVDRVFLAWLSPQAIAAAMPAGILNFTLMSIFIGAASYVGTFTAQYDGAGKSRKIGSYLWQGFYFSILAGLVLFPLYYFSDDIFRLAGHHPEVQRLESGYFRILVFSSPAVIASSAAAGFYSGRGKTSIIMMESFITTGVNIILDYLLIFGKGDFPALGMNGAALATLIAQYCRIVFYLILIFGSENRRRYQTTDWHFHSRHFRRLLRFGLPNGIHFFLEMTGFTMMIFLVGTFGTNALAATNITFNINHISFMPLLGLSMGVSVLVGRRLGEDNPALARHTTWSAFHIGFGMISVMALTFLFFPKFFILPYAARSSGSDFKPIMRMVINLLKFVAVYSFFDCMNIIFAAAIKGAGDTRFVMWVSVSLSWTLMVVPSILASTVFGGNLYWIWTFTTLYIISVGVVFLRRFLGGKWESMRVIETVPGRQKN